MKSALLNSYQIPSLVRVSWSYWSVSPFSSSLSSFDSPFDSLPFFVSVFVRPDISKMCNRHASSPWYLGWFVAVSWALCVPEFYLGLHQKCFLKAAVDRFLLVELGWRFFLTRHYIVTPHVLSCSACHLCEYWKEVTILELPCRLCPIYPLLRKRFASKSETEAEIQQSLNHEMEIMSGLL